MDIQNDTLQRLFLGLLGNPLKKRYISEDVKFRPREHVRDAAGHQTMQTTDRYIESDERERHQSGKRKRVTGL